MSHDEERPWSLKDAVQVARELERLGVHWMEEPLFRADRKVLRALRVMVHIRIAGGEMNREPSDSATSSRSAAWTCCSPTWHPPAASPAFAAWL